MTVAQIGPRLKGATRLLFRQVGSLEAVAHIASVSHGHAGRYQLAESPDFITIEKVAALESQEGVFPHVTQALAALSGHVLVPRPVITGDGMWAAHLAHTAKEAGDLLSGLGIALANDGAVSAAEAAALMPEVDQALSAITALRQELERVLKAAEPTKT